MGVSFSVGLTEFAAAWGWETDGREFPRDDVAVADWWGGAGPGTRGRHVDRRIGAVSRARSLEVRRPRIVEIVAAEPLIR